MVPAAKAADRHICMATKVADTAKWSDDEGCQTIFVMKIVAITPSIKIPMFRKFFFNSSFF